MLVTSLSGAFGIPLLYSLVYSIPVVRKDVVLVQTLWPNAPEFPSGLFLFDPPAAELMRVRYLLLLTPLAHMAAFYCQLPCGINVRQL